MLHVFSLGLAFSCLIRSTAPFSVVKQVQRGGGRTPSQPDRVDDERQQWQSTATEKSECRLTICQITDVYTLEHFASFKTLVEETRAKQKGGKVISMLTGDFLSPYLLSSVDRGYGMMNALAKIPLDYLTWGNHEADIDHRTVVRHVRQFPGTWLNSNMLDHEAMDAQKEYDVIEITSADGTQTRKVGLCAVLSAEPGLYSHFKAPGAFGGATLTDPWEALAKYKKLLEEEHGCDLVVPLEHLYVPDDYTTCRMFDFPVVLSGHDHHRVDEVVEGTRLIKPGMNGIYATVLEISWMDKESTEPEIRARFIKCSDYEADLELAEENERAYDALIPLRNTELSTIPKRFEPLSSGKARGEVCTMGKYLCTLIRSAITVQRRQRAYQIDAVLLMGGNIRGNVDKYPEGSFFSLEALEAEIKADEVLGVVSMPGWLLAEGVEVTHAGDPIPGWMQYDEGVQQDFSTNPPKVTHVGGEPLDNDRVYRVATKISDLMNGQSPPWTKYYTENQQLLPKKGSYINIQSELITYFARNLWRKIWMAMADKISEECDVDDCPELRLQLLDASGDGVVSVDEIQGALRDLLGYSVDDRETSFARFIHSMADTTGDGKVTLEDFQNYCDELADFRDEWETKYQTRSSFESSSAFNQVVETFMQEHDETVN